MKTWERNGYTVEEQEFNYSLHQFVIIQNDTVVAAITPASLEDMFFIIAELDNGEDVNGWEDGLGNTIYID